MQPWRARSCARLLKRMLFLQLACPALERLQDFARAQDGWSRQGIRDKPNERSLELRARFEHGHASNAHRCSVRASNVVRRGRERNDSCWRLLKFSSRDAARKLETFKLWGAPLHCRATQQSTQDAVEQRIRCGETSTTPVKKSKSCSAPRDCSRDKNHAKHNHARSTYWFY